MANDAWHSITKQAINIDTNTVGPTLMLSNRAYLLSPQVTGSKVERVLVSKITIEKIFVLENN
jgi:hypothetical protein